MALQIFKNRDQIHAWFQEQFKNHTAPFYSSVDIRDSGDKIAPVDSNLFPAGFNNICEVDFENASKLFKTQIAEMARDLKLELPKKILLIPETHTENRFYLENLYCLKTILDDADFETEIGWINPPPRIDGSVDAGATTPPLTAHSTTPLTTHLTTASGKQLVAQALEIRSGILQTMNGFVPDWVVLNNDFSQGYPTYFDEVKQPIMPTYKLGWHSRKKSTHFHFYNQIATEFATLIGIDPWHITIASEAVGNVDFGEGKGIESVLQVAEKMFATLHAQKQAHQLSREPALFIKNDSGTYGMGIMVVHSLDEIKNMNRRTKNKMSVGKNKSQIHQVIIQEGIPTQLSTDGHSSEPVIYMMGHELIGGFIRANTERDDLDNLNSQGMIFKKLCFKDLHDFWNCNDFNEFPVLEAVYGSIGRLSALAASREGSL